MQLYTKITAFPAVSRQTKAGGTQYVQRFQIDQDGQPAEVFSRSTTDVNRVVPAGPVTADSSVYVKRITDAQGYVKDEIVLVLRNLRAAVK